MTMYSNLYQYTHDVDWFFLAKDKPIHIASNGGLLYPKTYTAVELQTLQSFIEVIPLKYEFVLNQEMISLHVMDDYINKDERNDEQYTNPPFYYPRSIPFEKNVPEWMKAYSWSFCYMAMRGFYSFDRDNKTNMFFPVASPVNSENHYLSEKIKYIICEINEIQNMHKEISYDSIKPLK